MPANCLGKPQHGAKIPLLFHNFLNFIAMKNKNRRWRTKFILFGSNSVKTSSSKEKKLFQGVQSKPKESVRHKYL